jgi:type VI secretion system protein ImpB
MPENIQEREKRLRPQRVHFKCEVYIGNAIEKVNLPFIVGVMADLSGQPDKPLAELAEREFKDVDKTNFNEYLAAQQARLVYNVDNKMGKPDSKLAVELKFRHMDDFSPENVVRQVPELAKLLDLRDSLKEVRDRAKAKAKLAGLLDDIIDKPEKRAALAKELGIEPPAPPAGQS